MIQRKPSVSQITTVLDCCFLWLKGCCASWISSARSNSQQVLFPEVLRWLHESVRKKKPEILIFLDIFIKNQFWNVFIRPLKCLILFESNFMLRKTTMNNPHPCITPFYHNLWFLLRSPKCLTCSRRHWWNLRLSCKITNKCSILTSKVN